MKPKRLIEDLAIGEYIYCETKKQAKKLFTPLGFDTVHAEKCWIGRNMVGFFWQTEEINSGTECHASDFLPKKSKKASKKWVRKEIENAMKNVATYKNDAGKITVSLPIEEPTKIPFDEFKPLEEEGGCMELSGGVYIGNEKVDEIKVTDAETVSRELEVGKWYKHLGLPNVMVYCGNNSDDNYGFDIEGVFENRIAAPKYAKCWKPASPEQVTSALIKDAERRGYKDAITIVPVGYKHAQTIIFNDFNFSTLKNGLYVPSEESEWDINGISNPPIFLNGKWAEIIEQPKYIDFSVPGQLVTLKNNVWEVIGDNGDNTFMGILRIWDGEPEFSLHHRVNKIGMTKYTGEPIILNP